MGYKTAISDFQNYEKWKYMAKFFRRNVFENFSKNIDCFRKRRTNVTNILKVSFCSNFQLNISENGWDIRFFIFQYTGHIIGTTKFKCMFWYVLKAPKKTNGIIGFLSTNCIWLTLFYCFGSYLIFDLFLSNLDLTFLITC